MVVINTIMKHFESANTVNSLNVSEMFVNSCLFPIMRVKIGSTLWYANVLWDCCASICLITDSKAKELGLHRIPSEILCEVFNV